jgi:hypothetical protein
MAKSSIQKNNMMKFLFTPLFWVITCIIVACFLPHLAILIGVLVLSYYAVRQLSFWPLLIICLVLAAFNWVLGLCIAFVFGFMAFLRSSKPCCSDDYDEEIDGH